MKFDIVTVVYENDFPILEIQARSIAKYINLDIGRIIVIDNSENQNLSIDKSWYGKYQNLVEIHSLGGFFQNERIYRSSGYHTRQQLLKIECYKYCRGDIVIILDAKNWFKNTVIEQDLIKDNRLLGNQSGIPDCFMDHWDLAFECFDLDLFEFDLNLFSTITPFIVKKETLEQVYNYEYEIPIETMFRFKIITEFSLITSYIIKHYKKWDNYFFYKPFINTIWKITQKDIIVKLGYHKETIVTSISKNIWKELTEVNQTSLLEQWVKDKLVDRQKGKSIIGSMIDLNS